RHGTVHANANGFGESFLGGKAGCQKTQATLGVALQARPKLFDFVRPQYASHELFAMAGTYPPDAAQPRQIQCEARYAHAPRSRSDFMSGPNRAGHEIIPCRAADGTRRRGGALFGPLVDDPARLASQCALDLTRHLHRDTRRDPN